ncbi:unnamed protein product [Polarella glacialis]|uniref:Class I SAM-dependent methyltransferase n=1 Tax=Polarella glacialis TaxID=89957 RepID=A0A813JGA3_POLGL|nr:unnamed protein product [Polarella glacialis]CAE8679359.1 unnamed protein product [Polarella glacialis]
MGHRPQIHASCNCRPFLWLTFIAWSAIMLRGSSSPDSFTWDWNEACTEKHQELLGGLQLTGREYFNYTSELLFKGQSNQILVPTMLICATLQKRLWRNTACLLFGYPELCDELAGKDPGEQVAYDIAMVRDMFDAAVDGLRQSRLGFVSGELGSLDTIIRNAQFTYENHFRNIAPLVMGTCTGGAVVSVVSRLGDCADQNRELYFRLMAALVLAHERAGLNRIHSAEFHASATSEASSFKNTAFRAKVLSDLIQSMNATSILEVGVDEAEMSEAILDNNPKLLWYGIDCWAACTFCNELRPYGTDIGTPFDSDSLTTEEAARQRLARFGDRATLVKGTSAEAAQDPRLPPRFDIVFIDACHSLEATEEDLRIWAPRANLVAGHDYNLHFPGVPEAVHRLLPTGKTLMLAPDCMYWWHT